MMYPLCTSPGTGMFDMQWQLSSYLGRSASSACSAAKLFVNAFERVSLRVLPELKL